MHDPARKSPMAAMLEYIHAQGADVVAENLTSVQDRLHAVFRDLDARMEQVPMDATVLPVAYALMCRFSDHTMAIVEKLEREAPTATTWLEALAILRRLFDEFSSMRPMLLRFAELADFCPRLEAQPDEQGAAVHKVSVLDRDAGSSPARTIRATRSRSRPIAFVGRRPAVSCTCRSTATAVRGPIDRHGESARGFRQ